MKIGDWAQHIVTGARGEITELGGDLVTIKFVAANPDKRVPRVDQEATHRYRRIEVQWVANPAAGELIVVVLPIAGAPALDEFSMPWPADTDPPEIIITPEGDHLLGLGSADWAAAGRATYTRAFVVADLRYMKAAIGGAT